MNDKRDDGNPVGVACVLTLIFGLVYLAMFL